MRVTTNDRPRVTARIFMDSGEIKDAIVADDELGYVLRYRRDAQGKFVIAPNRNYIETEELWGPAYIERVRSLNPRS